MTTYSPWAWSAPHNRFYCYSFDAAGNNLGIIWGGPPASTAQQQSTAPANDRPETLDDPSAPRTVPVGPTPDVTARTTAPESPPAASTSYTTQLGQHNASNSTYQNWRSSGYGSSGYGSQSTQQPQQQQQQQPQQPTYNLQPLALSNTPQILPEAVQMSVGGNRKQRYIKTGPDPETTESLDPRYRRVSAHHQSYFFVQGKVFKMLWVEPAGLANPGKTRGSTHFSTIQFGELAYSEIRRFVVIRNCGTFSQCVPIQTYRRQGATKPGLQVQVHGVIHTTEQPPELLPNEGITKQAIRVKAAGYEGLEAESRINYGKPYAVEHNVKVLEVGDVIDDHKYLLQYYFENAIKNGT